MSTENQLKKMAKLVTILKTKPYATAGDLSEKLEISRRTLFRYFDELRLSGATITFNKTKMRYGINEDYCFFKHYLRNSF